MKRLRIDAVRLQKHLADLGFGSRRQMETWIAAGRVSINGEKAELGSRVGASDVVRIDGRRVGKTKSARSQPPRVLCYHKPVGEICSRRDEVGRPSVFRSLPSLKTGRWINVGRLDLNSSGLLLFTNDGELCHGLMHPSREIEREYAVRIRGVMTSSILAALRAGIRLDDGVARFQSIARRGGSGANVWYHVVLTEGRTREVRRLWESQNVQVSRLIRVRYGPIVLPRGQRAGSWRELESKDVHALQTVADIMTRYLASTNTVISNA